MPAENIALFRLLPTCGSVKDSLQFDYKTSFSTDSAGATYDHKNDCSLDSGFIDFGLAFNTIPLPSLLSELCDDCVVDGRPALIGNILSKRV